MMTSKTTLPKVQEIKRSWHLLDASTKSFGRLSSEAAKFLIGKHRTDYVAHLDVGDFVVVINADKLVATGNKMENKMKYHHSRYPGGITGKTLAERVEKDSIGVIRAAVKGMLPKNRLQKGRLARLKIYEGAEHPHSAQIS